MYISTKNTSGTPDLRSDMATVFREQMLNMGKRDVSCLIERLASVRRKERNLKLLLTQQHALLQVVSQQVLAKTPVVWTAFGVDAETQTDEQQGYFGNNEVQWVAREEFIISPVYQTLEDVLVEMTNKGIGTVFLSDWLVSLLSIIRRTNPDLLSFSSYYYENEARTQGLSMHMVKARASIYFMSALDNMCTYSPIGNEKALFPDSEALIHYAVAYASRLSDRDISYEHFCNDPLCYNTDQLALAIDFTIEDIVKFVKHSPTDTQLEVGIKSFPNSYGPVVDAVNELLQRGINARRNCTLLQFLPLSASTTNQKRSDITQKEKLFLGMIIRTALMWYMTYLLSSNVQGSSLLAYQALTSRCMTRDPMVMQSLCKAHKGPYISTGVLLPGLFAYLFYVSKETGMPQKTGAYCTSAPMTLHPTQSLRNYLHKWSTEDFEVRGRMATFIAGDSVINSDMSPTVAAFGHTPKNVLQGQIDTALVSFLHEIIMHRNAYEKPNQAAICYMKEVASTREYLQTSQRTLLQEYNVGQGNNMAFEAMTGFLKNPFLYKMQHTSHFDTYGRGTVQTTHATVVSSAIHT